MIKVHRVWPDIDRLPTWMGLMRIALGRWPSAHLFEYAEELQAKHGGTIITPDSCVIPEPGSVVIYVDAPKTGRRRAPLANREILLLQRVRKLSVTWFLVLDGEADIRDVAVLADEIVNIRQRNGRYETVGRMG